MLKEQEGHQKQEEEDDEDQEEDGEQDDITELLLGLGYNIHIQYKETSELSKKNKKKHIIVQRNLRLEQKEQEETHILKKRPTSAERTTGAL